MNRLFSNMSYFQFNQSYIQYIVAFVFGFGTTYFVHHKHSGSKKLILQWNKNCYHVHHWITFLLLILILHYICNISPHTKLIMYYFFLGVISEDLMFKNLFKIKSKCDIKIYD